MKHKRRTSWPVLLVLTGLAAATYVSTASVAAETKPLFHLVRPTETAKWTLVVFEDGQHPVAEFKGEIQVHGVLTAEWVTLDDTEQLQVLLNLTPELTKSLPTLTQFVERPWWPGPLRVRNATAAMSLSFGQAATNDFVAKKAGVLQAEGKFTISNYVVRGQCDHIAASADVTGVESIAVLVPEAHGEAGC